MPSERDRVFTGELQGLARVFTVIEAANALLYFVFTSIQRK